MAAARTTKKAAAEAVEPKEVKVILEQEHQMKLNDRKVFGVHPEANAVVIENKIGGDLYVTDEDTLALDESTLLTAGESKEFEGAKTLIIGAYSRPVFVLKHIAK